MERRLAKRISGSIVGCGLTAAAVIFVLAQPVDEYPLGYDPLTNKKYVLELQRFGGKANVVTAEFLQWFDTLWHGRNLAYTIAVLSVLTAGLFWIAATLPPLDEDRRRPKP